MNANPLTTLDLESKVIECLQTIYDPEIPVNIYDLGLIYDVHITEDACAEITMTLTSPACPVAGSLPGEVEAKVHRILGIRDVIVDIVWDPPWTPERMSEAARLDLGFW
jgi:FeS assembly SUF system protein